MKIARLFAGLFLILGVLLALLPASVLAEETPTPTPALEETLPPEEAHLTATYGTLEAVSGANFEYELKITFLGYDAKIFNLTPSGPKDWTFYMTPSYPKDKHVADIRVDPNANPTETFLLNAAPPYWLQPQPGTYDITLQAKSGDLTAEIKLKAIVTSKFSMALGPTDNSPYSTTATAGKDSVYAMKLTNNGTSTLDNITFSADKPEGWIVTFSPDKVDSILAGNDKTVDVKIQPAAKAIAGDYIVTLNATSKQAQALKMDVRVTVETPTFWGWAGVAIILVVVAGLAFVIMRFSRR